MASAVAGHGVRARDLKSAEFKWTDLKLVHTFAEDSPYKGHAVAYIDHPDDLALLGKTMGHCAGTHFVWACEEKIWYFFTIVSLDNLQPHVTLHAKQLKWVGKPHPRDTAPFPYNNAPPQPCTKCKGYGAFNKLGQVTWPDLPGVIECKDCKGTGYVAPDSPKGEKPVPRPAASAGGYPTFADVCKAFESVGRKYEAGKWAPLSFGSQTYEIPKGYKEPLANFDGTYGRYTIAQKPAGVEDATWDTYQKALASMKAQFDKGSGAVQVVGRTFKFDKKELYVLSFSGRGDSYRMSNSSYRGMMHEFFIESSKKKESDAK